MKKILLALLVTLCASFVFAESNVDSKWTNPPDKSVAITESDVTVYDPPLIAMWVGTSGDVVVVLQQDTFSCAGAPTHVGVVGLFRGRIKQVCAATVPTDLVGYPYTGP